MNFRSLLILISFGVYVFVWDYRIYAFLEVPGDYGLLWVYGV